MLPDDVSGRTSPKAKLQDGEFVLEVLEEAEVGWQVWLGVERWGASVTARWHMERCELGQLRLVSLNGESGKTAEGWEVGTDKGRWESGQAV